MDTCYSDHDSALAFWFDRLEQLCLKSVTYFPGNDHMPSQMSLNGAECWTSSKLSQTSEQTRSLWWEDSEKAEKKNDIGLAWLSGRRARWGWGVTTWLAWSLKRSKLESLMQGTFYFIIVAMLRINKNRKSIHDFNCNIWNRNRTNHTLYSAPVVCGLCH